MLVGDLEQAAALETDPVRVLLDLKIESLPLLSPLQIKLLYQVSALPAVETCHDIE